MTAYRHSLDFIEKLDKASKATGITKTEILEKCFEGYIETLVDAVSSHRKESTEKLIEDHPKEMDSYLKEVEKAPDLFSNLTSDPKGISVTHTTQTDARIPQSDSDFLELKHLADKKLRELKQLNKEVNRLEKENKKLNEKVDLIISSVGEKSNWWNPKNWFK